jgi:MerR family transcriptional regulator, light-induced transcriptional regulator
MYTIRQAALRSGVSVPLIRAWERRYGLVRPGRLSNGYRVYDDASINLLLAMRRLVNDGWQPSAAAAALRDGTAPAIDVTARPRVPDGVELADRFADAAARFDGTGLEAVLDEISARGSYEATIDSLMLPAAVALGERWERGELDAAAEHAASAAIMRRLSAAFEAAGLAARGRRVVVGLPPGAHHELGALAFATALRRRGVPVIYLGADVPIGSWVHAVTTVRASAVVLGAVRRDDAIAARKVLEALHDAAPDVRVAIGGRFAGDVASADVLTLPDSVVTAAETLERALR